MVTRSSIFSKWKTALTAASLTASDIIDSSLTVTIKGSYNDNKDKRFLPVVTIDKTLMPNVDTPYFSSEKAFDSRREVKTIIDIYATKNTHIEQISQQIDDYITTNGLSELSLIGFDEDDELQPANTNMAHHRAMMFTFKAR